MGYQTQIRPAHAEPIPAVRAQVLRTMLSVSMAVDGFVDTDPGRHQSELANCYLMPQAGLLLGGTLCRRPLVMREFADVCRSGRHDGIMVRLLGDPSSLVATFDVHQANADAMHWAYRMWMSVPPVRRGWCRVQAKGSMSGLIPLVSNSRRPHRFSPRSIAHRAFALASSISRSRRRDGSSEWSLEKGKVRFGEGAGAGNTSAGDVLP